MTDGLRLAVGTLTALRVGPPRHVDRSVARTAMVLAPLVGLGLGLVAEAVVLAVRWLVPGTSDRLLAAALAVATLAWCTRAIHLDGLADTADGLGSGRSGAPAVALMRQPEVGAFGVVAVATSLIVQVSALDAALLRGRGTVALVGGCVISRLALSWTARCAVPAAASDGLGATVASTVRRRDLLVASTVALAVLLALALWEDDAPTARFVGIVAVAAAIAVIVGQLLVRRAVGRLGGITGDVMGAVVELTFAAYVVSITLQ